MMLGVVYTICYENPRYIRAADKNGGQAPPEERLPASLLGAVMLVIGLAWFAATCGPTQTHWIVPILAGVPFAFGMLLVFLPCMNYLVDCKFSKGPILLSIADVPTVPLHRLHGVRCQRSCSEFGPP